MRSSRLPTVANILSCTPSDCRNLPSTAIVDRILKTRWTPWSYTPTAREQAWGSTPTVIEVRRPSTLRPGTPKQSAKATTTTLCPCMERSCSSLGCFSLLSASTTLGAFTSLQRPVPRPCPLLSFSCRCSLQPSVYPSSACICGMYVSTLSALTPSGYEVCASVPRGEPVFLCMLLARWNAFTTDRILRRVLGYRRSPGAIYPLFFVRFASFRLTLVSLYIVASYLLYACKYLAYYTLQLHFVIFVVNRK